MLRRPDVFIQNGRAQDEKGSLDIDEAIEKQFADLKIPFYFLPEGETAIDVAFDYMTKKARKRWLP
jgi:MoaA/NifB/PqqE/SkfB family radical SAM enzyme